MMGGPVLQFVIDPNDDIMAVINQALNCPDIELKDYGVNGIINRLSQHFYPAPTKIELNLIVQDFPEVEISETMSARRDCGRLHSFRIVGDWLQCDSKDNRGICQQTIDEFSGLVLRLACYTYLLRKWNLKESYCQ